MSSSKIRRFAVLYAGTGSGFVGTWNVSVGIFLNNPFRLKSVIDRPRSAENPVRFFSSRGFPETTRTLSLQNNFNHWLAGFLDGDGCFLLSQKGFGACELTVKSSEVQILHKIKKYFGGSVTERSGVKAWRWRLHKKTALEKLLLAVSDKIVLIKRRQQLERLAQIGYSDVHTRVFPLSEETAWLVGFMEAEGSFCINKKTYQLTVQIGQKEPNILESIRTGHGLGRLHWDISWAGWIFQVSDVLELERLLGYFTYYGFKGVPKSVELATFKRFMLFRERGYHKLPQSHRLRKRFDHLINLFQARKKI